MKRKMSFFDHLVSAIVMGVIFILLVVGAAYGLDWLVN